MKLKEIVTALGWSSSNELYSCSDDKSIWKWNSEGEPISEVAKLDVFITDMQWFPSKKGAGGEFFVVAGSDGKTGRVEKVVEKAHKGAITAIRWNYEGTSLLTAGEDGCLKIWSRNGMLRTTLLQLGSCIYSVAWGPSSSHILLGAGKDLVIKAVVPGSQEVQWSAHDRTVVCVDWNPVTNLLLSGGEDRRYKGWDSYGRLLFQSAPLDSPLTSLAWAPSGSLFAVGTFRALLLCDRAGWTAGRQQTHSGSLFKLAWSQDSSQVAGGGGTGSVVFGAVVEVEKEWKEWRAVVTEPTRVVVEDVTSEAREEVTFRDRILTISLAHNHLIVATLTQCHILNLTTWGTPLVFDLKDSVTLILQSSKHFLTVDNFSGIQLYNYEGRLLANPKVGGIRTEYLNAQTLSLSNDFIAILDRTDRKVIHFVDLGTNKILEHPLKHSLDIMEICLNQYSTPIHRKVAFIDKNHDLYISPVNKLKITKMGTMVNSAQWNDRSDMLAAVADGKFVVWLYPSAVFFDKDLTNATKSTRDASIEMGQNPDIVSFFEKTCTVRRTDGALISFSVTPYPLMLYSFAEKGDWESSIRLCRFVKEHPLWACLAAMALDSNDLNTAEVAFAAIEEVDKLQFIAHIKEIPSMEGRTAELFMFKGMIREAEGLLIQAGFVWRAIKLNIRLFNWERALEIAKKHQKHIDSVVAYRQRYLSGKPEVLPEFLALKEITIEWEQIKQRIAQDKQLEKRQ